MTKVQIHFRLQKPLDDAQLERLSNAGSLYGLHKVQITSPDALMVEYDASRLRPAEVEAALLGAGIPVAPA